MAEISINEHDVVRFKDGREGTVVYVSKEPPGFLVELSDERGRALEIIGVSHEEVEAVIWKASKQQTLSEIPIGVDLVNDTPDYTKTPAVSSCEIISPLTLSPFRGRLGRIP